MIFRSEDGFTLIELLIVVAIIGLIAAIAIPGLTRARLSANEASAIGSLRAINSGEASFEASCASGFYATALDDLVKPPAGSPHGFVSPDLTPNGVIKSGYAVSLAKNAAAGTSDQNPVSTCNNATNTPANSYFAAANPVSVGQTGSRFFATETKGTIYQDAAAIANPVPAATTAIVQ